MRGPWRHAVDLVFGLVLMCLVLTAYTVVGDMDEADGLTRVAQQ